MVEYLYGFAQSDTACNPAPYPELAVANRPPHLVDVCNGATRTLAYRNVDWDQYPRCKRPFELRPGHPGSKRA